MIDKIPKLTFLPDLDITCDEAWIEMLSLLDKEMPVAEFSKAKFQLKASKAFFLMATVGASLCFLLIYTHLTKTTDKSLTTENIVKRKSFLSSMHETTDKKDYSTISQTITVPDVTKGNKMDSTNKSVADKQSIQPILYSTVISSSVLKEDAFVDSTHVNYTINSLTSRPTSTSNSLLVCASTSLDTILNSSRTNQQSNLSLGIKQPEILIQRSKTRILNKSGCNNAEKTQPVIFSNNRTAKKVSTTSSYLNNFHFGLEWQLVAPINGTSYYWYSVNGKKQPYTQLIPSVWVSKVLSDKWELFLDFKPFSEITGRRKIIPTTTNDTTSAHSSNTLQLVKLQSRCFGSSVGFLFAKNWMGRLGFEIGKTSKALISNETINQTSVSNELISVQHGDSLMSFVHLWNTNMVIAISYRKKWFETGMELRLPIQKTVSNKLVLPFSIDMNFRLKIK